MAKYSPLSSEFEPISDSEVIHLSGPATTTATSQEGRDRTAASPPRPLQATSKTGRPVASSSNLARSLSQRRKSREDSYLDPPPNRQEDPASGSSRGREASLGTDDERHRRGIEGDDEDSSAFEDVDDVRGRARTRRGRDPELKKSMLEDALRSSLATLLSLAPVQAGLSQTPAMSFASLSSLFQPSAASGARTGSAGRRLGPATSRTGREPPFAGALLEEEDAEEDQQEGASHADVFTASSSCSDSDSDADSSTELGIHRQGRDHPVSEAIPIGTSRRSLSDSVPSGSTAAPSQFSPLQSRPVGAIAAPVSPPASGWNRSRRGAAGPTALGSGRRRGRGRGGSASPGPASVEERRRARAAAAAAGLQYPSAAADWTSPSGTVLSEGEGQRVEQDEAFQDLLSTARFFAELSPRASRGPFSSLPSSYESGRTTVPPATSSSTSAWAAASVPSAFRPGQLASSSDEGGEEESDPALASESVPTLESLSSGAEGDISPSPTGSQERPEAATSKQSGPLKAGSAGVDTNASDKQHKKGGWFSWLRGLGGTVELKVWHLVGLCGVLIGAGWAAGTLAGASLPGSWFASRLHLAPVRIVAVDTVSRYPASSRFASLSASSSGSMSELFL